MLLMVVGISTTQILSLSFITVHLLLIAVTFGWVLFEFILRRKLIIASSQGATIFYSLLIVTASMALATLQNERLANQIDNSEPIGLYEWEDLTVQGEIVASGRSNSGRNVFTVDVQRTKLPGRLTWDEDYKIRLYACLLYTSPSPRDRQKSRMPSSA